MKEHLDENGYFHQDQIYDDDCFYWLIVSERGNLSIDKEYLLYGECYATDDFGGKHRGRKSIYVNHDDMGFFPERVFQIYDPVASRKFYDKHGHEEPPDQISTRGIQQGKGKRDMLNATQSRGVAKQLPFTPDDEWEIIADGTFEGGSEGTTSLYYFLLNTGTGDRKWIRKQDMGVVPKHVFHKWDAEECKAFFKNENQNAADNMSARRLRSSIAAAAQKGAKKSLMVPILMLFVHQHPNAS